MRIGAVSIPRPNGRGFPGREQRERPAFFAHVFQGAFHSALYERARKGDAEKGGCYANATGTLLASSSASIFS